MNVGRSTGQPSPHDLHRQAAADSDEYRRLMVKHGHLVPKEPTLPAATVAKMEEQMESEVERLRNLVRRAAPFVNAVACIADDKTKALQWMGEAALALGQKDALEEGGR